MEWHLKKKRKLRVYVNFLKFKGYLLPIGLHRDEECNWWDRHFSNTSINCLFLFLSLCSESVVHYVARYAISFSNTFGFLVSLISKDFFWRWWDFYLPNCFVDVIYDNFSPFLPLDFKVEWNFLKKEKRKKVKNR